MAKHSYRVRWEMEIDARNTHEAAQKALAIQRNPDSIATVFDVSSEKKTERVDLEERARPARTARNSRAWYSLFVSNSPRKAVVEGSATWECKFDGWIKSDEAMAAAQAFLTLFAHVRLFRGKNVGRLAWEDVRP